MANIGDKVINEIITDFKTTNYNDTITKLKKIEDAQKKTIIRLRNNDKRINAKNTMFRRKTLKPARDFYPSTKGITPENTMFKTDEWLKYNVQGNRRLKSNKKRALQWQESRKKIEEERNFAKQNKQRYRDELLKRQVRGAKAERFAQKQKVLQKEEIRRRLLEKQAEWQESRQRIKAEKELAKNNRERINEKYKKGVQQEKVLKSFENKKIKQGIKKQKGLLKKGKGGIGLSGVVSRAMLYMGFVSLANYMIKAGIQSAIAIGNTMASAEVDVLKGKGYRDAYRKRFGNTLAIDEASAYHSRLTGESEYMGRSRIGMVAGGLEASGIKVSQSRYKDIATIAQGISLLLNKDTEASYEGVVGILTGRRTPEEEGFINMSGGGSINQKLDKMLKYLKDNPSTAGILGKRTLRATMEAFKSAPKGMLAAMYERHDQQAYFGISAMSNSWSKFWSTATQGDAEKWSKRMSSFNQIMERSAPGIMDFLGVLTDFALAVGSIGSGVISILDNFINEYNEERRKLEEERKKREEERKKRKQEREANSEGRRPIVIGNAEIIIPESALQHGSLITG